MRKQQALIVVDVQHDFLPGGPLAVPQGEEVVPVINRLEKKFGHVIATQDWHPADHGSFATMHPGRKPGDVIDLGGMSQILWPVHCVAGTYGAEFSAELKTDRFEKILHKGVDPTVDSYSAFFDNAKRRSTGLSGYLREKGVTDIYLAGLATDYCIRWTAEDGISLGFRVFVIRDACRGINMAPHDVDAALSAVRHVGGTIIDSSDLH